MLGIPNFADNQNLELGASRQDSREKLKQNKSRSQQINLKSIERMKKEYGTPEYFGSWCVWVSGRKAV